MISLRVAPVLSDRTSIAQNKSLGHIKTTRFMLASSSPLLTAFFFGMACISMTIRYHLLPLVANAFRSGILSWEALGGWATLPLHPNERISFYGCRTLRVLKGPGLDAASLLNLRGNHGFTSGHGWVASPSTTQEKHFADAQLQYRCNE